MRGVTRDRGTLATIIRPACWEDRAHILRLILAMGGHEAIAMHPDPLRVLGDVLASPESRAFVAERDHVIVGYAELQARAASVDDRREAWLGALAVAADARNSGVGSALIAEVERAASILGCSVIVLESSSWRSDAHAFYAARGFEEKATARRFVRHVSPVAGSLEERFLAAAGVSASAVRAAIVALERAGPVGLGADGAPTEAADKAAEEAALDGLRSLGLPVVSEEAGLVGTGRIDRDQPWISLDPLDGSRNFVAGYAPYAVSIGLVIAGRSQAGFVCDLESGHRWWAMAGRGAWRDGRRIHASQAGTLVAVPSPPPGEEMARTFELIRTLEMFERVRISGSTTLDLCRVADGSLGAFVSLDREIVHVHDVAGALPIVLEAGGSVLDARGSIPLLVPDPAVCMRVVATGDPDAMRAALEHLGA